MRHNRGTRKRRGERWQLLWFWNAGREICGGACAMDRLCDWVHRYNELGLQDPFDRSRRNGPVIALSTEPVVRPESGREARNGRIAPTSVVQRSRGGAPKADMRAKATE